MKKTDRVLKSARLSSVSVKYVEDEDLRDTPARLFRKILVEMGMNPFKWNNYLRPYLDWIITITDREKAKEARMTKTGNIKETYFQKPTLTFNKLLEGLSILRMESCEIIIKVKDADGNIITVSEEIRIVGKDRANQPTDVEEPKA